MSITQLANDAHMQLVYFPNDLLSFHFANMRREFMVPGTRLFFSFSFEKIGWRKIWGRSPEGGEGSKNNPARRSQELARTVVREEKDVKQVFDFQNG